MNKRLKSLLYLGYKSCSLFFRHFERLVDFIVMRKVNPIKQCNRVVDDYVVRFTKEWAGRCHPLGWRRNANENTLGTLLRFHDEK